MTSYVFVFAGQRVAPDQLVAHADQSLAPAPDLGALDLALDLGGLGLWLLHQLVRHVVSERVSIKNDRQKKRKAMNAKYKAAKAEAKANAKMKAMTKTAPSLVEGEEI